MFIFFIVIQSILLLFMLFHDWLPIPPLNDLETLKSQDSFFYRILGSVVNGLFVLIPLLLTLIFFHQASIPFFAALLVALFYFVLSLGTIISWWIPYFFGSSENHRKHFNKFKNTHHLLPKRGDNVIPNTLHIILHLQVWTCLAISLCYL